MKACTDQADISTLSEEKKEDILNLLGLIVETISTAEFDYFLGDPRYCHNENRKENYRNGFGSKKLRTLYGPIYMKPPRDRTGRFSPITIKKRQRNIFGKEEAFISLVSSGKSRDDVFLELTNLSETTEDTGRLKFIAERLIQLSEKIKKKDAEFSQIVNK